MNIPLTKAIRALFARLMFVIHGLIAIWRIVTVSHNSAYWMLAFILIVIFVEGAMIIFTRRANENRWFCTCIFLYLCAVVPTLWLLQFELSPARRNITSTPEPVYQEHALFHIGAFSVAIHIPIDNELWLQLLQQTMLVIVILGRWILPKGDITRDQLSQLLLVFLAMGADIVELFDTFKENIVRNNLHLTFIVLGIWTVSLMQFPLILTGGRPAGGLPEDHVQDWDVYRGSRSMKRESSFGMDDDLRKSFSTDTTDSTERFRKARKPWGKQKSVTNQVIHLLTEDMSFWSIVTSTSLQDGPYLVTRLYLLIAHRTRIHPTMTTDNQKTKIVELNVGGCQYSTTISTLIFDQSSLLAQYFVSGSTDNLLSNSTSNSVGHRSRSPTPASKSGTSPCRVNETIWIQVQENGVYFLDRDGELFRYILDYLRSGKVVLPDNFCDVQRLLEEGRFYKLTDFVKQLKTAPSIGSRRGTLPALSNRSPRNSVVTGGRGTPTLPRANVNANSASGTLSNNSWGHITVGYRGTFAFGRDGQADVKFRKMNRILICGRSTLCREVFGDTLNESRDPDRGPENRYTSRLFLKHGFLELAFDKLAECGFALVASCASGTSSCGDTLRASPADTEEQKWNHYNEFIFYRPRPTSSISSTI